MLDPNMLFQSWRGLGRVVIVGSLSYLTLVVLLRISGKRTLAKMNSFDLVVTVALGSTLATVLLNREVALAEGVVAFATLILLQFIMTWLSVRISFVRSVARSEPRLLLYHGDFLHHAMKQERVTRSEILQAIRSQGQLDLNQVAGVVLETDGTFSVVTGDPMDRQTALDDVKGTEVTSDSHHKLV